MSVGIRNHLTPLGGHVTEKVTQILEFLLQLDALKSVNRKTYINGGE